MKIVEKKFIWDEDREDDWCCKQLRACSIDDGSICKQWLSSMFEIPDGVEAVWLSLHDRTSVNRSSMAVLKDSCGVYLEFEDYNTFESTRLDKALNPFAGKRLHLQCEYMA